MTLTDRTDKTQSHTLRFDLDLAHPPEKVWRALTEPALLSEWLLPIIHLELTPGAPFTFQAPPQPDWDGVVNGRVLEHHAPTKLVYAWVVGDIDTTVTFTLAPTPAGTHLAIAHAGFRPEQQRNFGGARYGWRMMGDKLIALLPNLP